MSQVSDHPPAAGLAYAASPQATSRLDRLALVLSKPDNTKRWYAVVVALCAVLVAVTLLLLIYVMPEGADIGGTVAFYEKYNTLLRGVSALLALVFLVGALWSGAFIGTLWAADPSRNRVYTWSALISEVLVLGLFFVESGMFASSVLLSGHAPDSTIHLLHVTTLVSAALLGPVWIPYTLAALLISRHTGLFPSWLNKLCVVVIVVDICTITGVFTLSGPLNGENGLIGAFAGVLGPVVWVGGVIAWEVVEWAQYRTSALSAVTS
ncbi:hypothetical protein [Mycobacteroides abscessus]|uniref:hypothetical protein n=1 Tax=Mycobacteroides abscessus TaxID=36809 RepID=UPI00078E6FA2|nr:hypothetical protein [Mycobacteroides abscessus]AMU75769.1 hypothetical protein A3O06_14935 [Mycobacteroides abscessus]ANO24714.1 hypothetical protein BAB79_14930 [Mycobacteroides abscessus]